MTVTRFPRIPAPPASATDASFVVNSTTGRVISAGPAAARVLGWSEARPGSYALDAAMPAFAQLRRFAKTDPVPEPVHQMLVWWGPHGSLTERCRLEHVATASREPAVRVTFTSLTDAASVCAAAEAAEYSSASPEAQAQLTDNPVPRDDRTTLQMIAQRIEDGVRMTSVAGPAPAPGSPSLAEDDRTSPASNLSRNFEDNGDVPVPVTQEANDNPAPAAETAALDVAAASPETALAALFAKTAHDIKTPLSAISAASEIIRDERLGPSGNERYRSYAADIHASARHALAIVDRLMKLPPGIAQTGAAQEKNPAPELLTAEPSKPNPDARHPSLDINSLLSGCAAELRPLIDNQNLQLTMRLDASQPTARADAIGLKQSLLNILTNAMKFTPSGGTIHIETERLAADASRITVRDTGRGMTKGAIARHLDPDAAISAPRPTATGLGLGLPQVRAFAADAGAELSIDSTLGRGTAVSLTFARG